MQYQNVRQTARRAAVQSGAIRNNRHPRMPGAGRIEINEQFARALDLLENTDRNVFITGKAGTGKSTLLEHFRDTTRKRIAVLAPTGVAAINVRGQTIHSFCGFKPDITLDKVRKVPKRFADKAALVKHLETVVIDEVSMVRADLLDCFEKFLRLNGPHPRKRFGGIQVVLIGDLYQLPPVVTSAERGLFTLHYESPWFFSAHVFADAALALEFVELEKIYRQTDSDFIGLLNAVRNRSATDEDLERLNARVDPEFVPRGGRFHDHPDEHERPGRGPEPGEARRASRPLPGLRGIVEGDFERSSLPDRRATRAQARGPGHALDERSQRPLGERDDRQGDAESSKGRARTIRSGSSSATATRSNSSPTSGSSSTSFTTQESKAIASEPVGAFTQYPLKLAWAVTIHKSQGKTFDRVVDRHRPGTFAHGQVYVALSRCTTFEGIVLRKPIAAAPHPHGLARGQVPHPLPVRQGRGAAGDAEKVKMIEEAVSEGRDLRIVYLKPDDTKSRRRIRPESIEMLEYAGKRFEGLVAYCYEREDLRHFRIDRMLEVEVLREEDH